MSAAGDDLAVLRVDQFFPHPPAKAWRALTEPGLLAQWQMEGRGPRTPGRPPLPECIRSASLFRPVVK